MFNVFNNFIKVFSGYVERSTEVFGRDAYFPLENGKIAKATCEESGIKVQIIHPEKGIMDSSFLPFSEYFKPVQFSPDGPEWNICIENGRWLYKTPPSESDAINIASAMKDYIRLFESI